MNIEQLSLGASVRLILRHRRLLRSGLRLFGAAVEEFFLPQFQTRLNPRSRPVAVVSHPLDDAVPFLPELFRQYLGYMTIWLKTLWGLYRVYGKCVLGEIEGMMEGVVQLYRESGKVYRHCQSTTTSRPAAPANPYFHLIAAFDPHLHCIPSLHVLTICYNYYRAKKTVNRIDGKYGAGEWLVGATYRSALRITETTLLVKQHSLLDIGPSLFLLSHLFPDYDEGEIRSFVSALFTDSRVLPPDRAERIREEVLGSYRELQQRHTERSHLPATETVLDYVREMLEPP